MQLKIQRSQRAGGIVSNTVIFCLDVRADYSPEEQDNVRKYRLGSQVIYNSQAARRHLDHAGAQLDRTKSGSVGERMSGLARGVFSTALAKMSLNISIASLGRGHHIECKDLEELLEAEETVRTACKNVTRYLEAATTFDGSETVKGAACEIARQCRAVPDRHGGVRGSPSSRARARETGPSSQTDSGPVRETVPERVQE